jgi:hypothetical protein
MTPSPEESLARVLALTGVALPRGVLGPETWALVDALAGRGGDDDELDRLMARAAAMHWDALRGPMRAAIARGAHGAHDHDDRRAFALVLGWADDPDPGNPLARALVGRAALELEGARRRAGERLRAAEATVAVEDVAAAAHASAAAGAVAILVLDLDPDDFAFEIAHFVGGARDERDVEELARATGDAEIRAWARSALAGIDEPDAPVASDAVRRLAAAATPEDPADDLVWVPAMLALVEEAVERALAGDAEQGGGGPG